MIAAASVALIPVRERIIGEPIRGLSGAILKIFYLICAAVASLGNEQVSLVLVGLILLANLRFYKLNKRLDGFLMIMLLVVLVASTILLTAPGNHLRIEQEISTSMPEFTSLTSMDKVFMGVKWLMHKTFNINRVLMILLLALLTLTYVLHSGHERRKWFVGITAAFASVLILTSINLDLLNRNTQEQWYDLLYNFRSAEKIITASTKLQESNFSMFLYLIPYVIWGGALVWIAVGLYHVPAAAPINGKTLTLVYLGAFGTLVILFFTPAMTLSANRILAVASIMFLWIAAALFHTIADRITTGWLVLALLVPVMSIVFQALEWKQGYSILW